jgi:glyoxylase-like metal-dependent hydrolase (beta-lactamase superfamily II)
MAIKTIDNVNDRLLVFRDKAWNVNATAVFTDEGVVLIDAFPTPTDARDIYRYILDDRQQEITHVIHTHHHWDHALGTQVYQDAIRISHVKCKERMLDYREQVMKEAARRRRLADLDPVYPDKTFSETTFMEIGGTSFELHYKGPAHTDNDLLVHLPEHGTLITADVFVPHTLYPVSLNSGGSISNWLKILRNLPADFPQVETVVPGHFGPSNFEEMQTLAEYMEVLIERVKAARNAGFSMKESLDEVKMEEFSHFRNFKRFHYVNIRAVWKDLEAENSVVQES